MKRVEKCTPWGTKLDPRGTKIDSGLDSCGRMLVSEIVLSRKEPIPVVRWLVIYRSLGEYTKVPENMPRVIENEIGGIDACPSRAVEQQSTKIVSSRKGCQ